MPTDPRSCLTFRIGRMHFHACEGTLEGSDRRLRRGTDVLNRTGSTRLYPPGSIRSNISLPTADEHLFASISALLLLGKRRFHSATVLASANASGYPNGMASASPLNDPGPAMVSLWSIARKSSTREKPYNQRQALLAKHPDARWLGRSSHPCRRQSRKGANAGQF
jgi:hypothetical protein